MDQNTTKVMFSSKNDIWGTPQELFDKLNSEFNFNIDVCALPENTKCENYFTPEDDGLSKNWMGSVWMNPPYSEVSTWIEKAYDESLKGSLVVALIPCRPDTKYFRNFIINAEELRFVEGRLKFGDSSNSAPFPSMVVVFNNNNLPYPKVCTYNHKYDNNEPRPNKVVYFDNIKPIKFIK